MSVQLIVYPQSFEGYSNSSNPDNDFIVDGINFSTVNGSTNTAITAPTPQAAVDYYNPLISVNTWYRYYNGGTGFVLETGNFLRLISSAVSTDNGILQILSNLNVGTVYDITVDTNLMAGSAKVYIFSGTILQSVQAISGAANQVIAFTANATEQTIVIHSSFTGAANLIDINSINVTAAIIQPSQNIQFLEDGQVICDLYEDEDLPLTLSVDDFKNAAEKVQSYSKAFNLPATKRNNRIFDHIFEVTREVASAGGLLFNPYKKTKCILKQNGFLLFEGFLRMLDISDKEGEISYNVNLYSEVVAFADTLQDRAFRDIGFTELEHLYNYTNIKLSQLNTTSVAYTNPSTSGFRDNTTLKYPFCDWTHQYTVGSLGEPVLPSLETSFRPFINIKYIIDRIFEATDFTFSSDFFNTAEFKNLYMDFNWGSDANPNTNESTGLGVYRANSADIYATASYTNFTFVDESFPSSAGFDAFTSIFTCPVGQENSTFNFPAYRAMVIAQRDADIQFRWVKNLGLTSEEFIDTSPVISLEGSAVAIVTFTTSVPLGQVATITIIDGGYYTSPPTVTIENTFFGAGATFATTIDGSGAVDSITAITLGGSYGAFDQLVFNEVEPTFTYQGSLSETMNPGDTLQLQWKSSDANYIRQMNAPKNNSLIFNYPWSQIIAVINILGVTNDTLLQTLRGELGQWEFMKGLITMFNLVTMPDENNPNNIKIEPYADIFINNPDSVELNWTEKIDISEMKLTPLTDLNRKNIFKFVEDDDDYAFNQYKNLVGGHLYGSKKYNAGNEFNILQGTAEVIAEPYAATVVKPLMSQFPDFITPAIYSYNPDDDTTEGFDNSPRILFNNGLKTLGATKFNVPDQNGVTGDPIESQFLQFSHLSAIPSSLTSSDFNFGECQLMPGVGGTIQNLFNLYWFPYYAELYNPNTRIMVLKVNLNPSDINTFKFNDTVFIKNRIFRVNKIDYKPNDLATVEFILIP